MRNITRTFLWIVWAIAMIMVILVQTVLDKAIIMMFSPFLPWWLAITASVVFYLALTAWLSYHIVDYFEN